MKHKAQVRYPIMYIQFAGPKPWSYQEQLSFNAYACISLGRFHTTSCYCKPLCKAWVVARKSPALLSARTAPKIYWIAE